MSGNLKDYIFSDPNEQQLFDYIYNELHKNIVRECSSSGILENVMQISAASFVIGLRKS
ncbi:MAG: hypothetical protein ACI4QO_04630 [Clostridia bacterium]